MPLDDTVGTADLPSLWNQRMRKGMSLHWDGNNDAVEERNKSAAIGAGVYKHACAGCHATDGASIGKVTDIAEIKTDAQRLESFTALLSTRMNTIGEGRPWRFSHFRKTNGYANMPLDGLWLRAPYLHNGSVPDLRSLLFPDERPAVFYRAYDVYDWNRVGFVSSGADAESQGVRFDTTLTGNSNGGHLYGTTLPVPERLALIEHLKTF